MEEVAKKSRMKIVLLIVLIIFMISIAVFLTYSYANESFIFKERVRPSDTGFTYAMQELVINLKGDNRYLKTKIALGYGVKNDIAFIQEKEMQLTDNIIHILRGKSREDIMPVENTQDLKKEIKEKLNTQFEEEIITDVYITEFLIQ